MSHFPIFKRTNSVQWSDHFSQKSKKHYIINSFRNFNAAKTIQKYVRGFITRSYIKGLHRSATIIQKTWRGHSTRVQIACFARKRYLKIREQHYNNKATIIQKCWKEYYFRKHTHFIGTVEFFKKINQANITAVEELRKFHKQEVIRKNEEMLEENKKWLNYTLPKLHHLIRTKAIPGIFSLNDGSVNQSVVEKLLDCYDFSTFLQDLEMERKKNAENCQLIGPVYKLEGLFQRDEKVWKRKHVVNNPKI